MLSHFGKNQDHVDIVFFSKTKQKASDPSSRNGPSKFTKEKDGEDLARPLIVSRDLANAIIAGRVARKLTRIQLANQCNLKSGIIDEIETCKAVYDPQVVNKITKILGINTSQIKKTT